MTVRRAEERQRPAVRVEKTRGRLPGDDLADVRNSYSGFRAFGLEGGKALGCNSAEDLVVLPAGQNRIDQIAVACEPVRSRLRERHTRNLDVRRNARCTAELGKIAGETVRDVHG